MTLNFTRSQKNENLGSDFGFKIFLENLSLERAKKSLLENISLRKNPKFSKIITF